MGKGPYTSGACLSAWGHAAPAWRRCLCRARGVKIAAPEPLTHMSLGEPGGNSALPGSLTARSAATQRGLLF